MIVKAIKTKSNVKFIEVKEGVTIVDNVLFIDSKPSISLKDYKEVYLLNDNGDTIEVIRKVKYEI